MADIEAAKVAAQAEADRMRQEQEAKDAKEAEKLKYEQEELEQKAARLAQA